MRMSLDKKLKFLLLSLAVISLIGAGAMRYRQHRTIEAFRGHAEKEFDAKINDRETSLKTFVNDYSYWDDLVGFVRTANTRWADDNIAGCITEYHADAIWIYGSDFSPVYAVNDLHSEELDAIPVPGPAFEALFAKSRFCHFFVNVPQGVMEIYGATIHPTSDSDRKTAPQGFLLAGRLWNDKYLGEIAAMAASTVSLDARPAPATVGTVVFTKKLAGWNGRPVAKASVAVESPVLAGFIRELRRSFNQQFYAAAAVPAVLLVLVSFFLFRWVVRPLGTLRRSAESGDLASTLQLKCDTSEFGALARARAETLEQEARLRKEVASLRQVEEEDKKEINDLVQRVQVLGEEVQHLRETLRRQEESTRVSPELEALRNACGQLEKQFQEATAKLHIVDELLQRQIIAEHEHHKEKLLAIYEKERAEEALKKAYAELAQKSAELVAVKNLSNDGGDSVVEDRKPKNKRKALGSNLPTMNYNEVPC